MVSRQELQKYEENLAQLVERRRRRQDDLAVVQGELRQASGELTRLLAEGVLSGHTDDGAVAQTEKRVDDLKRQAKALEAALDVEVGILAAAQAQVDEAALAWAKAEAHDLVQAALDLEGEFEGVIDTVAQICRKADALVGAGDELKAKYRCPIHLGQWITVPSLDLVDDVWRRQQKDAVRQLQHALAADLSGRPRLRADEPHTHKWVRGQTPEGVPVVRCDLCGQSRPRGAPARSA